MSRDLLLSLAGVLLCGDFKAVARDGLLLLEFLVPGWPMPLASPTPGNESGFASKRSVTSY